MIRYLLDVNVLVALAWSDHEFHATATRWFATHARKGWATCPMTQAGLVRILSNRAFSPKALTPTEALGLLRAAIEHPAHEFWPDTLALPDAINRFKDRLLGHQQITDAYLLGLAEHYEGKLATLDSGIFALLERTNRESIELIS